MPDDQDMAKTCGVGPERWMSASQAEGAGALPARCSPCTRAPLAEKLGANLPRSSTRMRVPHGAPHHSHSPPKRRQRRAAFVKPRVRCRSGRGLRVPQDAEKVALETECCYLLRCGEGGPSFPAWPHKPPLTPGATRVPASIRRSARPAVRADNQGRQETGKAFRIKGPKRFRRGKGTNWERAVVARGHVKNGQKQKSERQRPRRLRSRPQGGSLAALAAQDDPVGRLA